mmetsp:Transcript_26974/g.43429  ORF Transcript_26974/g.43429 Transcript_26974/m.43429 type:complete len:84 (-) Transcript_26974:4525-4776(-)
MLLCSCWVESLLKKLRLSIGSTRLILVSMLLLEALAFIIVKAFLQSWHVWEAAASRCHHFREEIIDFFTRTFSFLEQLATLRI